ncbi:MAG: precorrin-2 dehydrogenase/sirohydrochlorin ferrochelatase family protein [Gemmatimonadota bacterium]
MKYLPVGLRIQGKKCVVVGGGRIGTRKVRSLLEAGASVVLVSPKATSELVELAASGRILWAREPYRLQHLHGAFLAVAATDRQELNAQVAEDAGEARILVCDASSAERSRIIFGALHAGEGFTVAVFTDGENPAGARSVRDQIAAFLSEAPGPDSPAAE